MSIILSLSLFAIFIVMLSHLVTRIRPIPLCGALSLAFAGFIALETILLNCLSLFHGINRAWLLGIHLLLFLVWLSWALIIDRKGLINHLLRYLFLIKRAKENKGLHVLVPLLILIGLAALLFAPNNYDSLTYHMARVVHWIQNGSVGYYPTIIDRQNVMGPGAEYVILFFQVLTSSDRLAPLVQLISYIFLIITLCYLNRTLRIPQSWSPYIIILAASTPIAVMEASNTKNDLVASLMTLAIIIAGIRIIVGNFRRMNIADFGLLGVAVAAGYLVKPTSLVVAGPVLLLGFGIQGLRAITEWKNIRKTVLGVCTIALLVAVIAGPDLYRKSMHQVSRHEVYPLFSEYTVDRLWNPVRVLVHNAPCPEATRKLLQTVGYQGEIITKDVFNLQEDMIGNPYQASLFFLLSVMTICTGLVTIIYRSLLPAFVLSLSPMAAWCVFGLVVKDQGWITRLEMPLFFIIPFSFVFLGHLAGKKKWLLRSSRMLIGIMAFVSLTYGVLIACKIPARPLIPHYFWGEKPGRIQTYYNNAPSLLTDHDFFMKQALARQCFRVGLVMGPDSAEYPLTWRAMTAGIETRHLRQSIPNGQFVTYETVAQNSEWPCMIYADDGVVEHVPNRGSQWLSAGDYHTFYRNDAWDFAHSDRMILHMDSNHSPEKLVAQQDLRISIFPETILLVADGRDPQLLLPVAESGGFRQVVMKVVVSSPEDTAMQLFYKTATEVHYTEKKSIKRALSKGENVVYFPLCLDEIIGPIRLDIAMKPGIYKMSMLEIRASSAGLSDKK